MTNEDIYKLVNFVTRKDTKGTPETAFNFSRLLQQANLDHFEDEYKVYQIDQNTNDSISPFEVRQLVSGLTTTTTAITLPTDYAHFIGMYWTDADSLDRAFDLVTDEEWDMRCGSTITIPSNNYPICKLVGDKIYVKPNLGIYNDWFLPSLDELEQMYINLHSLGLGGFSNEFYWSSYARNVIPTTARTINFTTGSASSPFKNSTLRVRAARSFEAGIGAYNLGNAGQAGGLIFYIDGTTYYEAAPTDQSVGYIWSNLDSLGILTNQAIGTGQANTTAIINQVGHTDSAAKLCDDLIIE